MKLKLIASNGLILFLMTTALAAAVPVYEGDAQSNRAGRQGILEIPKQFATIIRGVLTDGLDRLLSTTTTAPAPTKKVKTTTVKPKAQQSNTVEVTTKQVPAAANTKPVDTFLDEFLTNNFLSNFVPKESESSEVSSTSLAEVVSSTERVAAEPVSEIVTLTSPPTSSFSVVENAFPSDFDDGVSLLGIVSTPGPSTQRPLARRTTPSPPVVVTTSEDSEVTTTEQFEEDETTEPTEAAETTTVDPDEEDETTVRAASSTADPDDDGDEADDNT